MPLLSFLRTIGLHLSPLPPATKMAQLIFRDQNYVCVYYTMFTYATYLVSDLEGSDDDDPLGGRPNGDYLSLAVSHGLVTSCS